jgi:NAD(P)-dependent dehydrogenase (short-subunit alcohol dehydrogenase family)
MRDGGVRSASALPPAAYAGNGVRAVAVWPGLTETDRVAEGLAADAARQHLDR